MAKTCTKCGVNKQEGDFSKQSNGKLKSECKECAVKRAQMTRAAKKVVAPANTVAGAAEPIPKTPYEALCEKVQLVLGSLDKTQTTEQLTNDLLIKLVGVGVFTQAQVNQARKIEFVEVANYNDYNDYLMIDEAAKSFLLCAGRFVSEMGQKFPSYSKVIEFSNDAHEWLVSTKYKSYTYTPAPKIAPAVAPKVPQKLPQPEAKPKTYLDYRLNPHEIKDNETYFVVSEGVKGEPVYMSAEAGYHVKCCYEHSYGYFALSKDTPPAIIEQVKATHKCGDIKVAEPATPKADLPQPVPLSPEQLAKIRTEAMNEDELRIKNVDEFGSYAVINWDTCTYKKYEGAEILQMRDAGTPPDGKIYWHSVLHDTLLQYNILHD